jgi:hypothetical protein
VALPRYLNYTVPGGITGLAGPRGLQILETGPPGWGLGVGRKASDLTLENFYCYEISNKNSRMDLSKTTFTTFKDNENLKPMGSRPQGRLRLRWLDDVCGDPNVLKVMYWKKYAMDKKALSDLSEKAKTHK